MKIKRIFEDLIVKHNTNNPFTIADNLGILILYPDMRNTLGFYSKYKRIKTIPLNQSTPEKLQSFVCAHELCHAIKHEDANTPFLKKHTLFSTDKIEREANTFAVELLLPDSLIPEYGECSLFNIAKCVGVPNNLIELKTLHQKTIPF